MLSSSNADAAFTKTEFSRKKGFQKHEFRCVICTILHFLHWYYTHFALVLHMLHSFLSQSELSNVFVYITSIGHSMTCSGIWQ